MYHLISYRTVFHRIVLYCVASVCAVLWCIACCRASLNHLIRHCIVACTSSTLNVMISEGSTPWLSITHDGISFYATPSYTMPSFSIAAIILPSQSRPLPHQSNLLYTTRYHAMLYHIVPYCITICDITP